MGTTQEEIDVSKLIRCKTLKVTGRDEKQYEIMENYPEIHLLNNFITGHLRSRGKGEGQYPIPYLSMIEDVFGVEPNTIEVCSRYVQADGEHTAFTVDLNPKFNPSKVTDGQTLAGIESNRFSRWRSDPPYNEKTADRMYGTELPDFARLLEAGARVCKVGSLLFLLTGPVNYQVPGSLHNILTRIGLISLSVVPNYELRALNIYLKVEDAKDNGYNSTLI